MDGLYVGVGQCQNGIEVAPVVGVERSVDKFHVLLRHRPRSIAPSGVRLSATALFL